MKKILSLLVFLVLCAMPAMAAEELRIVHATDMHYLSPSLTDYSEIFMQNIAASDGKVTHYTPQLMQAFVDQMLALKPDAVILSGDLTLNGAPQSHLELVEMLLPLKEAGIQLLALPGNHDTDGYAYRFSEGEVSAFDALASAEFESTYAALGYADAFSRDADSLSYVAQVSPDVWCLMLDVNANGTYGSVRESTFAWIEAQLAAAHEAGITVIAVSHQPVLTHNPLFTFGYIVNNSGRLLELYAEYDVQLNLCGHLHIQHIAESDGLVEIAGSSLAVAPNQYGLLQIKDGRFTHYETQPVDVSAWVLHTGQTDAKLRDFAAYAQAFFNQTTRSQVQPILENFEITGEAHNRMLEFAVRLNAEYFAGNRALLPTDAGWQLWEENLPATFFARYMRSILDEPAQMMNRYVFNESDA